MKYSPSLRRFYGLLLIVLLGMQACGRVEPALQGTNEPQSGQQAILPTLTLNAAELTKIAFVNAMATQETSDQATVQAGGELATPTGPVPSNVTAFQTEAALGYSPTPRPLYPEGLELDCGYDAIYIYGNCWNTNHNTTSYFMVAGSLSADPSQGVLNLGLDGANLSLAERRSVDYLTPLKVGKIEVESVTWPYVKVQSTTEPHTIFTFNLETRQWVSINGTPLPTTPPATPTGQ